MAYRIAPDETLEQAVRRIGEEQFDRALQSLALNDAVTASHETRKSIKRLRALLRLVRSGIGEDSFKRENAALGDVSRSLSGARDRDVIAATLASLAVTYPEFKAERAKLSTSIEPQGARDRSKLIAVRRQARAGLEACRQRWRGVEFASGEAAEVLEAGLARGLRDLSQALDTASSGEAEAVHEWRKAAQRVWRHMRLMEFAWPDYFRARLSEARAISELLGRSQDLSLIAECIKRAGSRIEPKKAGTLGAIIETDQRAARDEARLRTKRLTAEGYRGHARRAVGYFKSAVAMESLAGNAARSAQSPHATGGATETAVGEFANNGPMPPRTARKSPTRSKAIQRKTVRRS